MVLSKRAALLGAAVFAAYALLCAGCSKPADDASGAPAVTSGASTAAAPVSQKAPVASGAAPVAPPPLPGPPPGPK